jgi:hypothetical protein
MPPAVAERYRASNLDLEEPSHHAWLPLRPTGATLLNILHVIGRNNVFASLRVVHKGVAVREEAIEKPIEDAGGDEGVDVADVEPVQVESLALLRPSSFEVETSHDRARRLQEEEMGKLTGVDHRLRR